MDLVAALIASFVLLLWSVLKGYFVAYPLLGAIALFLIVLRRRGYAFKTLTRMGYLGSYKSFSVIKILLLIGVVIAVWIAAGTVPALVYYGIQWINPQFFILSAFGLTSGVSVLLGTSFGAVGTIGIALMMMAEGSAVNPHVVAGAIIAGAYLGDRSSPMSSSANLIASLTQTDLYINLRNMIKTAMLPLMVTCGLYLGLSLSHPVQLTNTVLLSEIERLFDLNLLVLLPAFSIIGLAILRVDVKLSMLVSISMAIALSIGIQHHSFWDLLKFIGIGFRLEAASPLQTLLQGGGLLSMMKVSIVVVISTAFAGILAGTKTLKVIETLLKKAQHSSNLFLGTTLIGIAAAAFGCTQTIAILLTQQLVEEKYAAQSHPEQLAVDLENTVVVLSPLIPWNIAGLVPASILMTDAGFIPYAFYLYLIPLFHWIQLKLSDSVSKNYATDAPRKR